MGTKERGGGNGDSGRAQALETQAVKWLIMQTRLKKSWVTLRGNKCHCQITSLRTGNTWVWTNIVESNNIRGQARITPSGCIGHSYVLVLRALQLPNEANNICLKYFHQSKTSIQADLLENQVIILDISMLWDAPTCTTCWVAIVHALQQHARSETVWRVSDGIWFQSHSKAIKMWISVAWLNREFPHTCPLNLKLDNPQ